jgi:exosome complex RNA-binding protein Csl4
MTTKTITTTNGKIVITRVREVRDHTANLDGIKIVSEEKS